METKSCSETKNPSQMWRISGYRSEQKRLVWCNTNFKTWYGMRSNNHPIFTKHCTNFSTDCLRYMACVTQQCLCESRNLSLSYLPDYCHHNNYKIRTSCKSIPKCSHVIPDILSHSFCWCRIWICPPVSLKPNILWIKVLYHNFYLPKVLHYTGPNWPGVLNRLVSWI